MCELRNHKLLTFVFVIQPLLWLQGIDRLNGLIIILGVGDVLGNGGGIPLMIQCYFWREAAAMLLFSSCWA